MKITRISAQKRSDRFNVYVGGIFWAGVSGSVLLKFNLYCGKAVQRSFLTEVFEYEICSKLYERCVRKLGRRPHSTQELRLYMRSALLKNKKKWFFKTPYEKNFKNYLESLCDIVADKLVKAGLLSDKKFAEWWVNSRIEYKPRGKFVIRQELISKGISPDIIKSVEVNDEHELTMLNKLVNKLTRNKSLPREKLVLRLKNKGFSWDMIKKVIDNHYEVD
ncbi:MAG: RecX family transcriptional regulator [Patescibacteria group bacterium]|nr:RecX family transcriptional regulator [Patescibacteria group bacterium]